MNSKNKPLSRVDNIIIQEFNDELLIYDLKIHKAYSLNKTSALVWQLCDGKNSITEIVLSLSKKLNSPVSEDFVWLALDGLRKENLLFDGEEISNLDDLSRRRLLKKAGYSAVVGLPIISSLVAPLPANAQSGSCLNDGAVCTGSTVPCCPGFVCNPVCGQCIEDGGLGGCL